MAQKITVFDEINADYQRLFDSLQAGNPFHAMMQTGLLDMWNAEIQYASRYGQRMPTISNIQPPGSDTRERKLKTGDG
jgi:hypothetical protein